jgi:hypothetical protein
MPQTGPMIEPDWMSPFLASLESDHLASANARGYRYDLRHFLGWYGARHDGPFVLGMLTEQVLVALALMCRSSYLGIIEFMRDVLGWPISIGTIHNVLHAAAEQASVINGAQDLSCRLNAAARRRAGWSHFSSVRLHAMDRRPLRRQVLKRPDIRAMPGIGPRTTNWTVPVALAVQPDGPAWTFALYNRDLLLRHRRPNG